MISILGWSFLFKRVASPDAAVWVPRSAGGPGDNTAVAMRTSLIEPQTTHLPTSFDSLRLIFSLTADSCRLGAEF